MWHHQRALNNKTYSLDLQDYSRNYNCKRSQKYHSTAYKNIYVHMTHVVKFDSIDLAKPKSGAPTIYFK